MPAQNPLYMTTYDASLLEYFTTETLSLVIARKQWKFYFTHSDIIIGNHGDRQIIINDHSFDENRWWNVCLRLGRFCCEVKNKFTILNYVLFRPKFTPSRKKDSRNILVAHLNINSLQNKIEELKELNGLLRAHVLFLTETKIDNTYPDEQFVIDGYRLYRKDRTRRRGCRHGRYLAWLNFEESHTAPNIQNHRVFGSGDEYSW